MFGAFADRGFMRRLRPAVGNRRAGRAGCVGDGPSLRPKPGQAGFDIALRSTEERLAYPDAEAATSAVSPPPLQIV